MEYYEPFPYKVPIAGKLTAIALIVRFWYMAPKENRMEHMFRSRLRYFICWWLWLFFLSFQLTFVLLKLGSIPRETQWIIALILPLKKEINGFIMTKLITKAALSENLFATKFIVKIVNNLFYSISVAIAFTNVTKTTEYLLHGVSFCANMALCYKAIRLDRRVYSIDFEKETTKLSRDDVITELVLNEIVEVMVPVAFIGTCIAGYYGPNKDIMGILGCSFWHQQNAGNFFDFLFPVIEMALMDFGSLILAGGMLWWFCHINIFGEYCWIIKKYWKHLAFHGGAFLSTVRI